MFARARFVHVNFALDKRPIGDSYKQSVILGKVTLMRLFENAYFLIRPRSRPRCVQKKLLKTHYTLSFMIYKNIGADICEILRNVQY